MYKEPNQLINNLLPLLIIAGMIGGTLYLVRDDVNKQNTTISRIRATTEQTETERIQLEQAKERAETLNPILRDLQTAENEQAAREEDIAAQRIKSNCNWVDSDGSNQKVLAHAQLYYPGTQVLLPAGIKVCDRSGNTGEIGIDGTVDPASIARSRAGVPKEYHRSPWFKQQQEQGGKAKP